MVDPTTLSATELARAIGAREMSAIDAVDAHIARIELVNPALNAVVFERFALARAEALAADRRRDAGAPLAPLHGVPVTLKECLDLEGTASTFGLVARRDAIAAHDEPHVARLRAAGAIVLAKTNVAQMLLFLETDNPVFGRTVNPHDATRSCGGSSGGEGAIIAAHGSPLGLGTDLGGSVRVPAAFCGIASIKPTRGRCPDPGRGSYPIGQQAITSQIGVLARDVDDLALALPLIQAPEMPALGDPVAVDLARLRIAAYEADDSFAPAPAVRRAVREATAMLRAAGATVVEWKPPSTQRALELFLGVLSAGGPAYRAIHEGGPLDRRLALLLRLASMPHRAARALGGALGLVGQRALGRGIAAFGTRSTAEYWRLLEALEDYRATFARALDAEQFDLVLSPAVALPAVTHGATEDLALIGAYTVLWNVLGYPAGVVPLTRVRAGEETARAPSRDRIERRALEVERGSAGLPVGVQIAARPWREHELFAAMRAIQVRQSHGIKRRTDRNA